MKIYGSSGDFHLHEELSHKGIAEVIETFVAAARRAREAGFDGVELHGANRYLWISF
jgi:2,4-dienoyl-CoA reductase-like NADH-dependent reductase (Old Yellow Enzyme family)